MKNVREAQFQILDEIVRICEIEKLNYFLMFGTLLGAIRHGGFIPWDDDVDLGMMREDYDKFVDAFSKHASDDFELQTTETDPYYQFLFLKVLKKDSIFIEEGYQDERKKSKIFVDIFPFDNAPNNAILQKIQRNSVIFFKSLLFYQVDRIDLKNGPTFVRIVKKGKQILSKILSRKLIIGISNTIMKSCKSDTDWVSNFGDKYIYSREPFGSLEKIPFDSKEFYAPVMSHDLLKYIYGDYMTLPPIEKRVLPHRVIRVEIDGKSIL